MYELEINGQVVQFNFGMGFLRRVNQMIKKPVDGIKDVSENVGLKYMIADVLDGSPEALVDVLFAANEGMNPRVTKQELDDFIDDPETDIDELFDKVKDFLLQSNATKKTMRQLVEIEEQQKEMEKKMKELMNQTES